MPPRRKDPDGSNCLQLTITPATGARYVPFLRRHLRAAHAILRPGLRALSLALVGDRRMAELHERFLHIAGPTDVLTFPLEIDRRGRTTAGEVVVCVPEARRRARAEGVAVEPELLLYALHGMLHLAGFDDRTDRGFAAMHRTEDDILTRLGVGPVFSTPPVRAGKGRAHRRSVSGGSGGARRAARRPIMGVRPSRSAPDPRDVSRVARVPRADAGERRRGPELS
jgi:probable rRNA maturation factor